MSLLELFVAFPRRALRRKKILEGSIVPDAVERVVVHEHGIARVAVGSGLLEPADGVARLSRQSGGASQRERRVMEVTVALPFLSRMTRQLIGTTQVAAIGRDHR